MPEISTFYGIKIKMYFLGSEHNPPHIHAIYNSNVAVIDIQTLKVIEGKLPIRALKLIKEWILLHKSEIKEMWETQQFRKIEPLK